jgi:hypothetical protein
MKPRLAIARLLVIVAASAAGGAADALTGYPHGAVAYGVGLFTGMILSLAFWGRS